MQNFVLLRTLYQIENVGGNVYFYYLLHPLCYSGAFSFILHGRWESYTFAQFWYYSRHLAIPRDSVCVL